MIYKAILGAGLLLASCSEASTKTDNEVASAGKAVAKPDSVVVKPVPADTFLDSAQFRVAKRDSFIVGPEGGYEYREKKLVKLTAAEEQKYLQSKIRHSVYQPYYFYSIHENTPVRQVITVLRDDGEYKLDLLRLVYNARHKLISSQVVAFSAGDGGVGEDTYGRFETPAVFLFTALRRENTRDDQDTMEYDIDSVVTRYTVRNEKFRIGKVRKFHRHTVVVAAPE